MDKIKRNERLAAMTQILTASPNRIFTLSHFCELFSTAKSTVSEDVAILQQTMNQFRLGKLETVTGAAGGVRYRPIGLKSANREFVERICERLCEPGRRLPGGYLYFSDILSDPTLVQGMGTLIASQYYDFHVDFVLTMETKGIPVAMMTANALHGVREEYLEMGFTDYISKPVDINELKRVVRLHIPQEKIVVGD